MSAATQNRRAFTILELLAVVGILILVLAVIFPVINVMTASTRFAAGMNTIAVGSTAARAYATRDKADLSSLVPGAQYSGVAILFTPSGELRLVENDQLAVNASGTFLESSNRNGYVDIPDRDYIHIPKGIGVVGIARNSDDEALFLPPPFAIRFDQHGHLLHGRPSTSPDRMVFYDGNYDGKYESTDERPNFYDPDKWDPESDEFDPGHWNDEKDKYELPFEMIDTVVAVMVYSKADFRNALRYRKGPGLDWGVRAVSHQDEIVRWFQDGRTDAKLPGTASDRRPIFFSRYTGAIIRK